MKTENEILALANSIGTTIAKLQGQVEADSPLSKQLELHAKSLDENIAYLESSEHTLAFVGAVGVGKTTAICHLLGLVNEKNEACLSTSSGRTTLCEVEIRKGETTRLLIDPLSRDEVHSLLTDFVDLIRLRHEGKTAADGENLELPAEVERCLRNLLNLSSKRSRKQKDGTRVTTPDRALELFAELNSKDKFLDVCSERLGLEKRNALVLECDTTSPAAWIKENFEKVNHGRHESAPIPRRITLEISETILSDNDLNISVVDTKGLDGNVEREDIDRRLNDSRTIAVLCSKFNDAPEQATRQLIQHMIDSGMKPQLEQRTLLLTLDRGNEAANVMAEDGPVEDKEDGRAVREGQIFDVFRSQLHLDEASAPRVSFYDAESDDRSDVTKEILSFIRSLRETRILRIEQIHSAVDEIEKRRDQAAARAAFEHVADSIHAWAKSSRKVHAEFPELYKPLVDDMTSKEIYASSLRASVNRKGVWNNFDFYYKLAVASRKKAVASFQTSLGEIRHVLDNLQKQENLRGAHAFIRQLMITVDEEMQQLLENAAFMGRRAFEDQLKDDPDFWRRQQGEWGQGPGYKNRVAQGTESWFHHHDPATAEAMIQTETMERWIAFIDRVEGLLLRQAST